MATGPTQPFVDPAKAYRDALPIRTASTESFDQLMSRLRSVQARRRELGILGETEGREQGQGVLSRLFDQRTGIITAPARASTAFLLDVLNYQGKGSENLKSGNPLESAIRSARGDFAITGGDIIPVRDGDDLKTRLAKYATALTFDIATDPINFFGGIGTLGRTRSAIEAVNQGPRLLPKFRELAGRIPDADFDDIIRPLVQNSAKYKKAVAKFEEALPANLSPSERAAKVADFKLAPEEVDNIVGIEFGRVLGDSLLSGGRARVRRTLKDLFKGRDDLVDEMFDAMPEDIAGGLFLRNPITGQPIARVAGGRGAGGAALERVNEARLWGSRRLGGQFIDRFLNGEAGPVLSAAKKNLIGKQDMLAATVGDTLLDYVGLKRGLRVAAAATNAANLKLAATIATVGTAARAFADDPVGLSAYESGFKLAFFSPKAQVPESASDAYLAGVKSAQNLRKTIDDGVAEAAQLGIEIPRLGPDWSPLMMTDDAYAEMIEGGVRAPGRGPGTLSYSATKARRTMAEYIPDPELAALKGYEDPRRPGVILLNAIEANKVLEAAGKKARYLEDPLAITRRYLESLNSTISAARMLQVAEQMGAITRMSPVVRTVLNELEVESFKAALAGLREGVEPRMKAIIDDAAKKLADAVAPERLQALKDQVAAQEEAARVAYTGTADAVKAARTAVRQSEAAVRDAQFNAEAFVARLREFGGADAEFGVAEAIRLRDLRSQQLRRARKTLEAYNAQLDEADNLIDMAYKLEEIDDQTMRIDDALISKLEADDELRAAREFRANLETSLGTEQALEYQALEAALQARAEARNRLDDAIRARDAARDTYQRVRGAGEAIDLRAIDEASKVYSAARANLIRVARENGDTAVKNLSPEQRIRYETARAQFQAAKQALEKAFGARMRKSDTSLAGQYLRTVKDLADKLSEDGLAAFQLMNNIDALNTLAMSTYGQRDDIAMNIVGDIYTSYRALRDEIPEEVFKELAPQYRRAMKSAKKLKMTQGVPEWSEEARAFAAETGRRQVGSGMGAVEQLLPKSMADTFAPDGVRSVLEQMYNSYKNPNAWQKWLADKYDPLALVWRMGATVGRGPGFILNNLVGAMFNNYIVRVSGRSHGLSALALYSSMSVAREIAEKNPNKSYVELLDEVEKALAKKFAGKNVGDKNIGELFAEFQERGGAHSSDAAVTMDTLISEGLAAQPVGRARGVDLGFTDEPVGKGDSAVRKISNLALNNAWMRVNMDLNNATETFVRFAAFLEGYKRYGTIDSAMDFMYAIHFDYRDLSQAEIWFKRFVPFYTWTRRNVPLQFRAAFLASDQVRKVFAANENVKEYFGPDSDDQWLNEFLPDFLDTGLGFASGLKVSGNHVGLFLKLPMIDLEDKFQISYIGSVPVVMPRLGRWQGTLGPVVRGPLEFLYQRNLETGQPIEGLGENVRQGIRTFIPQVGVAQRALAGAGLDVPALGIDREKQVANLINLIIGAPYGAVVLTEKVMTWSAVEKNRALSDQVKEAAAEANVDVDWLRKQVKSGKTPLQIRALIMSGQGSPLVVAMQKAAEERRRGPKKNDYREILTGLRGNQ